MQPHIIFNETNGIGEILLNRPKAYNALTHEMILALSAKLQLWAKAPHIKLILLSSTHEKVFCAGGDIKQVYEKGKVGDAAAALQFFYDEYRLNHLIYQYPKPYVVFLNGLTMGGGVGISVYGSHRIATDNYHFSMPETGIGFFPDVGGSYFLSRCPQATGQYLGLTGVQLKAPEALALKLIDYAIKDPDINAIKARLSTLQHHSNQTVRECLLPLQAAETASTLPLDAITQCFNASSLEAILSALQALNTPWGTQTAATLLKKSPLSLKVALEQLQRGRQLALGECLKMEYRMVQHFLHNPDFYTGVACALITKNPSPPWAPAQFSEISAAQVEGFFEATGKELELS